MRSSAWLLVAVTIVLSPFTAHAQVPFSANVQTSAGVRIACFSPQQAFSESEDGKATFARLKALQEEKTRAVEEKNAALQAQEQALNQSSALLSEAARQQRTSEVQKLRTDVQRFIEDAQAELLGIEREAENAFEARLKPALVKVAQEKGVQAIFNVDQIAWFDPSLDITSDVVKELALK